MSTLTRKQREIQQRQQRILDVSRPMLITHGYHGLSMDRIAEALEYSKGTIYNHFPCKEEIIIALAIETMEKRTELFLRGATVAGRPRHRMQAIGVAAELFVRLYADHFKVEHVIRSASIWEKATEERRRVMRTCEQRCIGIVAGIVRDAVAEGDLVLPTNMTPEELVFGLWSLTYGGYSIMATSDSLYEIGIADPYAAVHAHIHHMLDGYNWHPLSTEFDYSALTREIQQEVYSDEYHRIADVA